MMKRIIQLLFTLLISTLLHAQNFTGQWKGEFTDNSTSFVGWGGDRCEYVIEIECKGTRVSGYSYTYFTDGGKRYYTICKLKGTLNKAAKYIEVTEIERTKTNVPVNIRNCFQIHRLTYFKKDDEQKLEGSWIPVPGQEGDCGFGTTVLSRRVLKKNPVYYNDVATKNNKPKPTTPITKIKPKQATPDYPIVKSKPRQITQPPVVKSTPDKKTSTIPKTLDIVKNDLPVTQNTKVNPPENPITDTRYEKRNNDLLKTIEIENSTFTVDLYDNGEIDGDSISLFFNGKLLLSNKRLSDKAISLKLNVDESRDVNELIMYAENLGSIPPNTALMIVKDGENRYEVRISSDLKKSGVIRFVHKLKPGQ